MAWWIPRAARLAAVNDVVEASALLHGQETNTWGDSGYQGAHKRPDSNPGVTWHVAAKPGKRRVMDKNTPLGKFTEHIEKIKASMRAKVDHPFRVLKRQFGHVRVRSRGLAKNTAQLHTQFALAKLWLARRKLGVVIA